MFLLIAQALSTLNFYVGTILPPAAVALGGLGNIFSLLVFILSPLRKLRSSSFLIGLSTCHLVSLACIFLVWLERVNVFLIGQPGWCQVLNYLFHLSNFLGVAFVLSFTVERYISFCWNRNSMLRGNGVNVQRRCVAVTIALVVIFGLFYGFLFGMLGSVKDVCRFIPIPGYNRHTKKIPQYILSLMHIIIGFMLVATLGLDISIVITIVHRSRKNQANGRCNGADSRSLQRDFCDSVDNLSIGRADDLGGGLDTCPRSKAGTLPRPLRVIRSRELRRSRSLTSIRSTINATRMLFAASLTFTLLQIAFAGLQFFVAILFFSGRSTFTPDETLYNIFVSMYIISLAIAFVVYMFCGHNFREAVKMLLTCQYGRAHAHSPCGRRRKSKRKPPMITEDHEETPHSSSSVNIDSVSRYIDETSNVNMRQT